MKKLVNILLILLLIFSSPLTFTSCKSKDIDYTTPLEDIKNLIILIGDGMGDYHINNAKTYYDLGKQNFEKGYLTTITTHSLSLDVTDSAAAGTALATGKKVYNGQVGHNGFNDIKNIMEYASDYNMLTGIITNDNLYGATPAAFSAHAKSRGHTLDILNTQSISPLDLMIGKYAEEYNTNKELFTSNGFTLCSDTNTLYSTPKSKKVIANLNNIYSIYNPSMTNQTNMVDLVNYAINYLDNDNGFVLMMECGYIDKFSHSNDIISTLAEVKTLIDVANNVCNYISTNPDTALIITSDHETGGLTKANTKQDISNNLFTTGSHTNTNVNLYTHGIKTNTVDDFDNTMVFQMCHDIISNK